MNEKLARKLGWLGLVSLLSYTAAVVFSPLAYPGYDWMSQAVSDLSADSAPSRVLWSQLGALYMPCSIVCVTVCCVTIQEHFNKALRAGVYLFTVMNWISAVGYTMFPLTQAGISGQLQDVMHLIVTAAVVLLSIASLTLIAYGGLRQRACAALGIWALAALCLMMAGAVGTAVLPRAYFGIPERFSVFACSGFTAVLGLYQTCGWKESEGLMKKTGKQLLVLGCILGILVLGFCSLMNGQVRQMYEQLDGVGETALSEAADGTYEGNAETPLVKVTVEVTVENHTLKEIRLLRHENGKGTPAEAMLPEMIRQNTSEVDSISGATMSSKAIRAAVRDALEKAVSTVIQPLPDSLAEAVNGNIPDGVYHVTADGSRDYSADGEGQYLVLQFWSYETFDKDAVNQMAIGDILYVHGEPLEVRTLERSENNLGETTYVNINGGMAEDGITLAYDYEGGCFRESAENDSYVLYSAGPRKVKLAEDFLYADHSSTANPGDPEPDWARGDAAAFPAFIVGRELYGNNSYAQIRNGELTSLNIEWVP